MKFVFEPSLQHRALVRIAVSLWNQNDVRALIAKFSFRQWKQIKKTVTEKVSRLPLPQLLKELVLSFVKPIGLQILEWKRFHALNLPAEFSWTPQGTIDGKKTAEMLVKDENLDISTRYKLARIYCLEDHIHKLWNTVSEAFEDPFSNGYHLFVFWSCIRERRELSNSHISYKSEFIRCAIQGYTAAAEYLLQKLSPREREEALVETAKCVTDTDMLCFLLSKMNEEQQLEIFKNNSSKVFHCLLQWPLQGFFIEVADRIQDFLLEVDYNYILRDIIRKVTYGYKDWNYQKLFREFWRKIPGALRSSITNKIDRSWLLPSLLRIKDKEKIRLILKDATLAVKEKLIYSDTINCFCQSSIRDSEWGFLEFLIQECSPSKNEMLKFKEEFEKCVMWVNVRDNFARNKHKWDQIFCSSDDSICKCSKRSAEETESRS